MPYLDDILGGGLRMPAGQPSPWATPEVLNAPAPQMPQLPQALQSPWDTLVRALQDPVIGPSVLRIGTALMQPVPVGQSPAGHAGAAVMGGVNYGLEQRNISRRYGLEERGVATAEKRTDIAGAEQRERAETGAVTRRATEQEIAQKGEAFPALQRKLEGEIKRQQSQGTLDEVQAAWLGERIKQYPREVDAEMKRSQAALVSAGKPTQVDLFDSVVRATARAEDKTEDQVRATLGGEFFGRTRGGAAAGVQNLREVVKMMKETLEGQIRAGEEPKAHEQRVNQMALDYQKSRAKSDYSSEKLKFLQSSALLFSTSEEAEAAFDRIWKEGGRPIPGKEQRDLTGQRSAAGQIRRDTVGRSEIEATARKHGVPPAQIERELKQRGVAIDEAR